MERHTAVAQPAAETVPLQVVDALRRGIGERLVAVVLFGSRARGDAHEGSDWDVLVIAKGLPERMFDRNLRLRRLLFDAGGTVSVIAKTPDEFERHLPSLYLDIATDGRILFDPHGYAAARLTELQSIIHEAGLYRVRTDAGDLWRWRRPPRQPWKLEWKGADGVDSRRNAIPAPSG